MSAQIATATAAESLAVYGFTVHESGNLMARSGAVTDVRMSLKKGRLQMRNARSNDLLWSGSPASAGEFVRRFWFAQKVTQ